MKKFSPLKNNRIQIIEDENCERSTMTHFHESYVAGRVLGGEMILRLSNRSIRTGKGEVYEVPPFAAHACLVGKDGYYSFQAVSFKYDDKTLVELEKLMKENTIDLNETLKMKLFSLISRKSKTRNLNENMEKNIHLIKKVRKYIKDNMGNKISLNDLGLQFNYHPCYLQKLFKKETGLTPLEYQLVCRLRKAKKEIESSKKVVSAGLESGFYDQSHFVRHFKKLMGVSPKYYVNTIFNK